MPTLITHVVSGLAVNSLLPQELSSKKTAFLCALCAAAPDLDAIGFRIGIPYSHWLGHRGVSHGILFAVLLAALCSLRFSQADTGRRWPLFSAFFISAFSHDLLDAMTDGGLGIAFFSPFSNNRLFLPWRPIEVSPISLTRFFSLGGWSVLKNEFLLLMVPSLIVIAATAAIRRVKQTA